MSTQKIKIADYNAIRTKVINVVGTGSGDSGYGYPVISSPVTTSSRITKTAWTQLGNDITNARRQQTGTDPTLLDLAVGSKVRNDPTTQYFTRYDTLANQVVTDRFLVSSASTINIDPVTRDFANNAPWYTLITSTVTVDFTTADQARYFFNTGGEIQFTSSRSDPSGANPNVNRNRQNNSWTTLLNNITNSTNGYQRPRFGGRLPEAGSGSDGRNYYRLTGTYQQWYTASPPTEPPGTQLPNFGVNKFRILARHPDINNKARIEFRAEWNDAFDADYKFDDGVTGRFSLGVTLRKATSFALAGTSGNFSQTETPTVTLAAISTTADSGPAVPEPPAYSITQNKTQINETSPDNTVTYTISTQRVPEGVTLFWGILGTASDNDFDPQTRQGSVTVSNPYPDPAGSASITITARADATSEQSTSPENFTLRVYLTEIDRNNNTNIRLASNQVTIIDTSRGTPVLSITSPTQNQEFNEGTSATWSLTTTNIPNAASISYAITGTVGSTDYSPSPTSGTVSNSSSDGGYSGSASLALSILNDNSPFPGTSGADADPETLTVTFSYPGASPVSRGINIRDTSFQPAPPVTITNQRWLQAPVPAGYGPQPTSPSTVYEGNSARLEYTAGQSNRSQAVLDSQVIVSTGVPLANVFTNPYPDPAGTESVNVNQTYLTGPSAVFGSFRDPGTKTTEIEAFSRFVRLQTVKVNVNLTVQAVPIPTISMSMSPSSYTVPGSSTLSWSTSGANYVTISWNPAQPALSGDYPSSGNMTVNITTAGSYTATGIAYNGPKSGFPGNLSSLTKASTSASASLSVSTTTTTQPPPPPPFVVEAFWANNFDQSLGVTSTGFNATILGPYQASDRTFIGGLSVGNQGFPQNHSLLGKFAIRAISGGPGNVTITRTLPISRPAGSKDISYGGLLTPGMKLTTFWSTINSMTSSTNPSHTATGPGVATFTIPSGGGFTYVPHFVKMDDTGVATNVGYTVTYQTAPGTPTSTINITGLFFGAIFDDASYRTESIALVPLASGNPPGFWTTTDADRAISIGQTYYSSNSPFTLTGGNPPFSRWGLRRLPDVYGASYWSFLVKTDGKYNGSFTGQAFINDFFGAMGTSGGDFDRSITSVKSPDPGFLRSPHRPGQFTGWYDRY